MRFFDRSTLTGFQSEQFFNLEGKARSLQEGVNRDHAIMKPLQAIYRSFNFRQFSIPLSSECAKLIEALANGTAYTPPDPAVDAMTEAFEADLLNTHPDCSVIKAKLDDLLQDVVRLSGSGVTLVGLFAASHPSDGPSTAPSEGQPMPDGPNSLQP